MTSNGRTSGMHNITRRYKGDIKVTFIFHSPSFSVSVLFMGKNKYYIFCLASLTRKVSVFKQYIKEFNYGTCFKRRA